MLINIENIGVVSFPEKPEGKYIPSTRQLENGEIEGYWQEVPLTEQEAFLVAIKGKTQLIEVEFNSAPLFLRSIFASQIQYCIAELIKNPSQELIAEIIGVIQKTPSAGYEETERQQIETIKQQFINILQGE